MGELIPFRKKPKKEPPTPTSRSFRIFEGVSKIWGADFDKILLDKDEDEAKKLNRAIHKANLAQEVGRWQEDLDAEEDQGQKERDETHEKKDQEGSDRPPTT